MGSIPPMIQNPPLAGFDFNRLAISAKRFFASLRFDMRGKLEGLYIPRLTN
jgi:hypothetical protein